MQLVLLGVMASVDQRVSKASRGIVVSRGLRVNPVRKVSQD